MVFHQIQWNPVNTVTNGPKKIGRINEGCFTRKCMAVFARRPKQSGDNNEVAVRRGFTLDRFEKDYATTETIRLTYC